MKSLKKTCLYFFIISILTISTNYYVYANIENFTLNQNDEKIENTKNYTEIDYMKLDINQLSDLQELYYAKGLFDKCELVSNLILDEYNGSDIYSLTLLSIIYAERFDFTRSLEYNYRLLPLVDKDSYSIILSNIADIYLVKDLNKSIEILEKAISNNRKMNNEFLSKKLLFFKNLKHHHEKQDKFEYSKNILSESNALVNDIMKKYIIYEYENNLGGENKIYKELISNYKE